MRLFFSPANFVLCLPYLAKGMIGIFAVMALIILVTAFLNVVTKK